jgi:hypothetical protein
MRSVAIRFAFSRLVRSRRNKWEGINLAQNGLPFSPASLARPESDAQTTNIEIWSLFLSGRAKELFMSHT